MEKVFRVAHVTCAQAPAAGFVLVRRADAFRRCPDLSHAARLLGGQLVGAVVGQDQVRPVTDQKPVTHLDSGSLECLNFPEQRFRVNHDSVADDGDFVGPDDSRRDELEDELRAVNHHRMAGVCAALVAGHDIKVFG